MSQNDMTGSPSYCGVNCHKCPVYEATIHESLSLKQKVAKEWGLLYKRNFEPNDMICNGCKSDQQFGLCQKCDIKVCNSVKGNDHCKVCMEYPCERIQKFESYLESKQLYYR